LINIRSNTIIYFFLNLISKPLPEQQIKFRVENLFTLWGRANEERLDMFINEILLDPIFIRFGVFLALNNIQNYFDPATYDFFANTLEDKVMLRADPRLRQIKPLAQVIKVKESKSTGELISFAIAVATFNVDLTTDITLYPINLEEKMESQELAICVKTLAGLALDIVPDANHVIANTIFAPYRFNTRQVMAILFLVSYYLEKHYGNPWEQKMVSKYLLGLLENKAFYFLELVKMLYQERDISENVYVLA